MLKIRLSCLGSKKKRFFRIIVSDSRSPRDGKFIENIGFYDPIINKNKNEILRINTERFYYWKNRGAKPTKTILYLMKLNKKGLKTSKDFIEYKKK